MDLAHCWPRLPCLRIPAFLATALLILPLAADGEEPLMQGCVETFRQDITVIGPLCGAPIDPKGTLDELSSSHLENCEKLGYHYATVYFDVPAYLARTRDENLGTETNDAVSELAKQIDRQMTEEEQDSLTQGFGMCLPEICGNDCNDGGIPKVVILYFGLSFGLGDYSYTMPWPQWCTEINATLPSFPLHEACSGSSGRGRDQTEVAIVGVPVLKDARVPAAKTVRKAPKLSKTNRVKGQERPQSQAAKHAMLTYRDPDSRDGNTCFEEYVQKFTDGGYNSGAPYIEVDGSLLPFFIMQYELCTGAGLLYALVHLESYQFMYDSVFPTDTFGKWLETFIKGFFFEKLYEGEVDHLRTGYGMCFPRSCEDDLDSIARSISFYFGRLAGVSDIDSTLVPKPQHGKHFNVTFDYALVRVRWRAGERINVHAINPPLSSPDINMQEQEAMVEREDALASAKYQFELESWHTCHGPDFDADWPRWRRRFRAAVRTFGVEMDRETVEFADIIIQHFQEPLMAWIEKIYWANAFVRSEGRWPPIQDLTRMGLGKDGKGNADKLIGFCPLGAFTALLARAWGRLQTLNHDDFPLAVADFEMARMILGPQRELDVLDKTSWGITSLDMEVGQLMKHKLQTNGRPFFAESESIVWGQGRLYTSFAHAFPLKGAHVAAHVWNALRLNTFVRQELQYMESGCSASRSVSVSVIAWPPVYALYLMPHLLLVQPELRLGIFHIGPFESRTCPERMEEYRKRFLMEAPELSALPYTSTAGGGVIDWDNVEEHEVTFALWRVFSRHPFAAGSQVVTCSAPAWFCVALRAVTSAPMIVLNLAARTIGAPPGIIDNQNDMEDEVGRDDFATFGRAARSAKQTLQVREDMGRSYTSLLSRQSYFVPWVALLSLYIHARHKIPAPDKKVLLMREGALGRFSDSARGRFFYACLKEADESKGLWNFRYLISDASTILTYQQLADHRAIVFFPAVQWGKLTFKDLIVMEAPMLFPTKKLLTSIIGHVDIDGDSENAECSMTRQFAPWSFNLCKWLHVAFKFEIASWYRYPHLILFGGIADLLYKILELDDRALKGIHEKMKAFNRQQVEDDVQFWKSAVRGMACGRSGGPAPSAPWFRGVPLDPTCMFGIKGPQGICCAAWCGDCIEENCKSMPEFAMRCCPSHIWEHGQPCAAASSGCYMTDEDGVAPLPRTCLDGPEKCRPEVLRFATHLDDSVPQEFADLPPDP